MIAGVAVPERVCPGGIGGQHASNGALGAAGRVGGKTTPRLGQLNVKVPIDDAGLDAHRIGPDFQNGSEMSAEVHDQARAEGFPGHAAARPARNQRDLVLGRVPNQVLNIFFVLRDNDPQRLHLKDASIRAVQSASQVVKEELTFEDASKVIAKVLALLLVHRFPASRGPPLIRAAKLAFVLTQAPFAAVALVDIVQRSSAQKVYAPHWE